MDVTKAGEAGDKYYKGNKCGAVLTKLKTIAIFVLWDEEKGHSPAGVAAQVGSVCDYLRSSGIWLGYKEYSFFIKDIKTKQNLYI